LYGIVEIIKGKSMRALEKPDLEAYNKMFEKAVWSAIYNGIY
jgi:hypothetical protein